LVVDCVTAAAAVQSTGAARDGEEPALIPCQS
jgi:hypothetical protein